MPPLQLTDDEMSVLRRLAEPLDQQRRTQFLQEVAAELEAKRQAGEIGEGGCIASRGRFSGSFSTRRISRAPSRVMMATPGGPLNAPASGSNLTLGTRQRTSPMGHEHICSAGYAQARPLSGDP
jgi:hypothetical protein